VNLPGDADGAGLAATSVVGDGLAATSVFAFLRLRFSAGEAEAAAGLSAAAGEADVVASGFLCARRFVGEGDASSDSAGEGDAAGDSAGEGDAASSAGEAVVSACLCARCFAGEGDVSGVPPGTSNWACTREMLARPITEMSARNLVVIKASLEERWDCGQRISLGGRMKEELGIMKEDRRKWLVIGDWWSVVQGKSRIER
jgi:hypothetical protein